MNYVELWGQELWGQVLFFAKMIERTRAGAVTPTIMRNDIEYRFRRDREMLVPPTQIERATKHLGQRCSIQQRNRAINLEIRRGCRNQYN